VNSIPKPKRGVVAPYDPRAGWILVKVPHEVIAHPDPELKGRIVYEWELQPPIEEAS
jgi:hypothetical protein